ncbi:MAG: hypothetical protein HC896_08440 [Bacteroidales bacterium]|nr:hypothetical protein [Bacteroidales bacterium]
MSNIDYSGTAVDVNVSLIDHDSVMLDAYDLEILELSYTHLSETEVEVYATAHNRGIAAGNVWFSIYPVYGHNGTPEFPFAQLKIKSFAQGETVVLRGNFTLPKTDVPLYFMAIIDEAQEILEVVEQNNSATLKYGTIANSEELLSVQNKLLFAYPNPVSEVLNFSYRLENSWAGMQVEIFNMQGKKCWPCLLWPIIPGKTTCN